MKIIASTVGNTNFKIRLMLIFLGMMMLTPRAESRVGTSVDIDKSGFDYLAKKSVFAAEVSLGSINLNVGPGIPVSTDVNSNLQIYDLRRVLSRLCDIDNINRHCRFYLTE